MNEAWDHRDLKRNRRVVKSFSHISEGSATVMLFPFPSFLTVHLIYTLTKRRRFRRRKNQTTSNNATNQKAVWQVNCTATAQKSLSGIQPTLGQDTLDVTSFFPTNSFDVPVFHWSSYTCTIPPCSHAANASFLFDQCSNFNKNSAIDSVSLQ